jgi:tetratricopeptide (TPR) repeat protein
MQSVGVGEKLVERCSDKLAKAHQLKDEGNQEFKAGGYRAAIKKYHHSLMYTRGVVSTGDTSAIPGMEQMVKYVATEDEKRAAKELSLVLSNNLAACFLKTGKWEKVLEYASKVLEGDPDNSKALFRRGTARIHLNEPDKAREDLSRAQSLTPDNKEIKKQLALLEKKTRELESLSGIRGLP